MTYALRLILSVLALLVVAFGSSSCQDEKLNASFRLKGLDENGNRYDSVHLVIDEVLSTRTLPLLHYIFFETNSTEIPERYLMHGEYARDSFDPHGIRYINAVDLYKHVLDIVGYRMLKKPNTSIVITGTMSVLDTDKSIGRQRAQVVCDYITSAWGINPSRIRVTARDKPHAASNKMHQRGNEENQRAEITSSDASLFDPIVLQDSISTVTPQIVKVSTTLYRSKSVSWSFAFKLGDNPLKEFAGVPPEELNEGAVGQPFGIAWKIQTKARALTDTSHKLVASLHIDDGVEQFDAEQIVPREVHSLAWKRRQGWGTGAIESYDLILFDLDRFDVTADQNRSIAKIKDKLPAGCTIEIVGYQDEDDPEFENRLHARRARSVHKALGQPSAVHSTGQLTDYEQLTLDTPEGRFYARRVRIQVTSPIQ